MWIVTAVVIAALGLTLYYWHHIVYFFQKVVIPAIRRKLGNKIADMISWFIALLNGTAIVTRRALKSCWKWLRENLLGYRGTYVQKGPNQWIEQTEFNSIEGSLVTERVLSSDEVPAAIRNEAIKHNQSSFVIDQKSILEEQARKVAQRAGMEDVLVNEV